MSNRPGKEAWDVRGYREREDRVEGILGEATQRWGE
jgi:hypothetical protein